MPRDDPVLQVFDTWEALFGVQRPIVIYAVVVGIVAKRVLVRDECAVVPKKIRVRSEVRRHHLLDG